MINEAEALATEPWIGARDGAILVLLYGAGLRISEALAMTGAETPAPVTTPYQRQRRQSQARAADPCRARGD